MSPLDPQYRTAIIDALRAEGVPKDRRAAFLAALDDIRRTPQPEKSSPPLAMRRLLHTVDCLKQQVALMRKVDAQAADCVYLGYSDRDCPYSLAEAANILQTAAHAVVAAKRLPAGRPATPPKVYRTARAIAVAVYVILERRPTATRDGWFEGILALALESVTGQPRESDRIHQIACRVLKYPDFP